MPRIGFRFSLRVLIYTALLAASAMWLVDQWPAWKLERTFGGQTKPIRALAFSPDGRRLFSGGEDGALHSISMEDGTRWIATSANPDTIHTISVSPDSTRVFAGGSQRTGSMWEAASGKKLFTLEKAPGEILASAFAPDGSFIVTGSGAQTAGQGSELLVWDANNGTLKSTLQGHKLGVVGVGVSADSQLIFSGAGDRTLRVWNVKDALQVHLQKTDGVAESFALSPDSRLIAYTTRDHYFLWDTVARSGVLRGIDYGHDYRFLSWSGDSKRVLSSKRNQGLEIREIGKTGWREVWPRVHPGGCNVLSPDGKRIAFLTTHNTIGILVNQRPEAWYGIFYLPAFWITLLIAAALLRTILAERKVLAEPKPPA